MFICCTGNLTRHPLNLQMGNQNVFSLEELCYVVYHNVYILTPEFFSQELEQWLREETDNGEVADKLEHLRQQKATLKDRIVTLLCSCDYYKENEIRHIIQMIDSMGQLPVHEKAKIKADQELFHGHYGKAAKEYNALLQGEMATEFSPVEYGNILHNLGVAHYHIDSFAEARRDFIEAYARNDNQQSLFHYLYTFLMEGEDNDFVREAGVHGLLPQDIRLLQQTYETQVRKATQSAAYQKAVNKELSQEDMERYKNNMRDAF